MIIHSDWHVHSEFSYDATLPLEKLAQDAASHGFCRVGVTDHLNFNDESFLNDMKRSAEGVKEFQKTHPHFILGVELTPIEFPEFAYIAKTGTREGYLPPSSPTPYAMEFGMTKEELMALGVKFGIGAAHWRVDVPHAKQLPPDLNDCIKEWYRQQLWMACDERVTILGHPWYHGKAVWYEDFSVIPRSMNDEISAALKENGKYAECNAHFFCTPRTTEKFRHQYAEYLREMHEMGIPITYGSDAHSSYGPVHLDAEKYLMAAGFKDGDIVELREEDFWK